MARRRLKKKFKKKINRAVRRFSAFTMALILMTVLLSLESFSSHAEEIEDASADTLTIVELGETESIVTEETTDVISDGTEGSESESGDVVEGESGEAIEDESEEISEEVSEEVSEEISEEVSEDESEEISEDISGEISEDESEELSEEASEEISEEVSEETSEKGKEKKSKDDKKKEKDSKDKKKKETVTYEVGDIITFGQYEQDGNYDNGVEDIEWVILSIDEEKVLVVSKYALDCQPYNTERSDVTTWETCSLRAWLNNDFLNAAFSEKEQESIPEVTIANENNSYYGTEGGNETMDRVFCLSVNEVKDYYGYTVYNETNQFGFGQDMMVEPTQYTADKGATTYAITEELYSDYLEDKGYSSEVIDRNTAKWWLRTPGFSGGACYIGNDGFFGAFHYYNSSNSQIAVRPALFLSCSAVIDLIKMNKLEKNVSQSIEEKKNALDNELELSDIGIEKLDEGEEDIESELDGEIDLEDDEEKKEDEDTIIQDDNASEIIEDTLIDTDEDTVEEGYNEDVQTEDNDVETSEKEENSEEEIESNSDITDISENDNENKNGPEDDAFEDDKGFDFKVEDASNEFRTGLVLGETVD